MTNSNSHGASSQSFKKPIDSLEALNQQLSWIIIESAGKERHSVITDLIHTLLDQLPPEGRELTVDEYFGKDSSQPDLSLIPSQKKSFPKLPIPSDSRNETFENPHTIEERNHIPKLPPFQIKKREVKAKHHFGTSSTAKQDSC